MTSERTKAKCQQRHLFLQAFVAFEVAFEKNPEHENIIVRLGLAQVAAGKLEDAEVTFKEYINARGDAVEAEVFGGLAVALYAFGEPRDIDEAVRLYREARDLAPDFEDMGRMREFRQWPQHATIVLAELMKMADTKRQGTPRQSQGCGCIIAHSGTTSVWLCSVFVGLWFFWRRRA